MERRQAQDLDELLDVQREKLFELQRRASREGWSIDELERALAERLAMIHRTCMDWLKDNQSENPDRRSHDDQGS